jgi:Protein of unknown function (DUF1353)
MHAKNLALDSLPLMKRCLFLLTLFCAGCGSHQPPAWDAAAVRPNHPWGYYSGQVEARWENDGRHMTLLSELRYIDPDGVVWIAPAGSVVDGASIPRVLWSFMGGPFDGKYRNGSVLHDVAYDQKTRPWQEADRMFYNAMRCSGVSPTEAKTMYYALYRHGRHWKYLRGVAITSAGDEQTVPRALPVSEAEIEETRSWIENANPSLSQIEARAAAAPSQ